MFKSGDSTLAEDSELNDSLSLTEAAGADGSTTAETTKDELTDILSPHFNLESMVRESGMIKLNLNHCTS